jgi:hypothetical protein
MAYEIKRGKLASAKAKFERANPGTSMAPGVMITGKPIAIISEAPDGGHIVRVFLHKDKSGDDYTYWHFGIVVHDFVQHVANAYDVPESAIWAVVDKERELQRRDPTRVATRPLPDDYSELADEKSKGTA